MNLVKTKYEDIEINDLDQDGKPSKLSFKNNVVDL